MKKSISIFGAGMAITMLISTAVFSYQPGVSEAAIKKPNMQLKKFSSATDFRNYLSATGRVQSVQPVGLLSAKMATAPLAELAVDSDVQTGNTVADRYSTTNVQVAGIDEPDIVKTSGSDIFLSQEWQPIIYYMKPTAIRAPSPGEKYPYYQNQNIKVVQALPASDAKVRTTIPASGNLLYKNNILISLDGSTLTGYNVQDSSAPTEKWKAELGKNTSLVGARLYGNTVYVVMRDSINYARPCPYLPITVKGTAVTIPCGMIYHPVTPVTTDVVYTLMAIDSATGAVTSKASFTGSTGNSVVYMSPNNMYVTYYYSGDQTKFNLGFLQDNKDVVPAWVITKVNTLLGYDISDGSKQTEFYYIMSQWRSGLTDDEALKLTNTLQNRLEKYSEAHKRDMDQTGIVKIGVKDLTVQSVGTVPGQVLNQYALDEYNGNLRVAVTVGQAWWNAGVVSASIQSANDLYVLGTNMNIVGSVKDLGVGERVYAARFIGDRGYLVTFKQTDPFFVLDLSNPASPRLAGELKVPGYSSYLEPIGDHVVLGIGEENNKVKAALYDVSDANNPTELSKYILDEYWSDAVNNPHAFLKDTKHSIFFIPGSQGGYVFSYAGNELHLTKAVAATGVKRALYINDNLYILGSTNLSIWDENSWNKVNDISLVSTSTINQ